MRKRLVNMIPPKMNLLKKIIVTSILLLITHVTIAQHVYAVAVTHNGILFGKYKTANETTTYLPDTISLEDAKNIVSINAIQIDKDRKLARIKVLDYQMTIVEEGEVTIIKNNSEMLSKEMKQRLHKIKSGAKLTFEGIIVGYPDGDSGSIILLSFTVI